MRRIRGLGFLVARWLGGWRGAQTGGCRAAHWAELPPLDESKHQTPPLRKAKT